MKSRIQNLALAGFAAMALMFASTTQAADAEIQKLQKESQQAMAAFIKADSTLKPMVDQSAGYVIFPNVGKGGLVVGGARGTGLVYEKNKLIGKATMTQASFGAQAGGQVFSELILFETPEAVRDFQTGKFEMSADVGAVIAAEGKSKSAAYKQGVAVFALPRKGAMAQAAIGGQKFKFEPLH
jgi:lipid-binding SYLF domain-containing protein